MVDGGQRAVDDPWVKERQAKYVRVVQFEDLEVYKRAFALALELHQISLGFPKIEQFALANQIRRSSKAICANIAEGYGKQKISQNEFKRYLSIALGSSDETRVWIQFCIKLGYIAECEGKSFQNESKTISRMLQSLMNKISQS